MIWKFQKIIGMPRVAAIEHPFGRPLGDVNDSDTQQQILMDTIEIFREATEPGYIKHLEHNWHQPAKETKWHPKIPAPVVSHMRENGLI